MSPSDEAQFIAESVRQTYVDAGLPWPPMPGGPVPLDRLIATYPLNHEEIPGLSRAVVASLLGRWGVRWSEIPNPDPPLAGFLYANARGGSIFVRRGDVLARRRFTAAHELGHYRLHLAPALARCESSAAEMSVADETIAESDEADLATVERQANRFATELLMPENVCRVLFGSYSEKHGPAARFLVHHLAGELLVSREAMGWRLYRLGLIQKPSWLKIDRETEARGAKPAEAV